MNKHRKVITLGSLTTQARKFLKRYTGNIPFKSIKLQLVIEKNLMPEKVYIPTKIGLTLLRNTRKGGILIVAIRSIDEVIPGSKQI